MAFLKETERSLRWYFIIVGVLATVLAFAALGDAAKVPSVSALVSLAIWFPVLARIVLGPMFVIAGVKLQRSLETGAKGTMQLVKIAAGILIVEIVLEIAAVNSLGAQVDSAYLSGRALGSVIVPLLILWYIHSSLRRLTNESQRRIVDTVGRKFD